MQHGIVVYYHEWLVWLSKTMYVYDAVSSKEITHIHIICIGGNDNICK